MVSHIFRVSLAVLAFSVGFCETGVESKDFPEEDIAKCETDTCPSKTGRVMLQKNIKQTSAVKCEGNCAAQGVVTSSYDFNGDKCGVTTGGPYDPVNCPMKYLGWTKDVNKFCPAGDGAGGPWVEVDLGAATDFNTIEVVQPQRKKFKPPGYCGLEVWVDGVSVFSQPGYTESPKYNGQNQVTTVTGTFSGQKVKVKYGRSAKNPTAHLYGINIYSK